MERDRNTPRFEKITRAAHVNQHNLDQSLPDHLFHLESSLSFDFERNMNAYRGESPAPPLPDNGFRQPSILPYMASPKEHSSNVSSHHKSTSLNQNGYNIADENIKRVRGLSFSCERSTITTDRNGGIFGISSNSSASRTRSHSFVENRILSFSDNECVYCKSFGAEFHGHDKNHCPVLSQMDPCSICGASGPNNHTKHHCPHGLKELLQVKPEFSASIGDNIRRRQRQRKEEQDRGYINSHIMSRGYSRNIPE